MRKIVKSLAAAILTLILLVIWTPTQMAFQNQIGGIDGSIRHYPEAMVKDDRLVIVCSDCGYEFSTSVALEIDHPHIMCDGKLYGITVQDNNWTLAGEAAYVVLYEGAGKTDYPLTAEAPTKVGYYTVSLALQAAWEAWDGSSTLERTNPQKFEVTDGGHDWSYAASGFTMTADCTLCGEHAEVEIDTAGVYEASRTYDGGELDYEVFYEDNWTGQKGIEPYYVLYDGYETVSETESNVYDRAYVRPSTTGSYEVRVALLTDPDNPNTAWLSTELKAYYLADISINDCRILTYGDTEKSQFTQPKQSDGYYQVGTLSELLWCTYYGGQNCNVALTNDIVVNPITVTDDGKIRSAKYRIYNWQGFGTKSKPFYGDILGNGWTIYGIYHPKNDDNYAGFINYCEGSDISNLTIENSVVQDIDAAALVGRYNCRSGKSRIENCNALNCYIFGSNCHGGIIGWFTNDGNKVGTQTGVLYCTNCVNNSYVQGRWAGGIVGKAKDVRGFSFTRCHNGGEIKGDDDAGGIIGRLDVPSESSPLVQMYYDTNTGKISAGNSAGGLIGYIGEVNYLDISRSTSIGYINVDATHRGGIVGRCEKGSLTTILTNYYYDAPVACEYGSNASGLTAQKLTKQEIKSGFLCSTYGHRAESHWSNVTLPNCEKSGCMELTCQLCNQVMETQTLPKRNHYYEYGQCVYCGAYEDDEDLTASVFTEEPHIIVMLGVLAALLGGGVCLLIQKKRAGR